MMMKIWCATPTITSIFFLLLCGWEKEYFVTAFRPLSFFTGSSSSSSTSSSSSSSSSSRKKAGQQLLQNRRILVSSRGDENNSKKNSPLLLFVSVTGTTGMEDHIQEEEEEEGDGEDEEKVVVVVPSSSSSSSVVVPPEMPWSELHSFALRDNLPRYIRILPPRPSSSSSSTSGDYDDEKTPTTPTTATTCYYALWRTMMQDVPELSGYPIEFLREQYDSSSTTTSCASSSSSNNNNKAATVAASSAPDVLPFLDNFYFEPSGGLSGQVYGVAGLKDGTKIETSPVGQVEVTVPLGYVLTEDDGIAYELGRPRFTTSNEEEDQGLYSLDGITRTAGSLSKQASATMSDALMATTSTATDNEEDPNVMLIRLGASTGLLLASAAAVSMLSHHLTVNVFWV